MCDVYRSIILPALLVLICAFFSSLTIKRGRFFLMEALCTLFVSSFSLMSKLFICKTYLGDAFVTGAGIALIAAITMSLFYRINRNHS